MPMVYIKKNFYDEIAKRGLDPAKVINELLETYLKDVK